MESEGNAESVDIQQIFLEAFKVTRGEPITGSDVGIVVATSSLETVADAGAELKSELESDTEYPTLQFPTGLPFGGHVSTELIVIGLYIATVAAPPVIEKVALDLVDAAKRFLAKRIANRRDTVEDQHNIYNEETVTIYGPKGETLKIIRTKNNRREIEEL